MVSPSIVEVLQRSGALRFPVRRTRVVRRSQEKDTCHACVADLEDYAIHATDGTIGHVKDIYFDDEAWVARYPVVGTGKWL